MVLKCVTAVKSVLASKESSIKHATDINNLSLFSANLTANSQIFDGSFSPVIKTCYLPWN